MEKYKLPARKRDLLDDLNLLRNRRSLAYRLNYRDALAQIHIEMKDFWLRNGWMQQKAHVEYLHHVNKCANLFITRHGNPAITHVVVDEKSGYIIHLNSIAELSKYWLTKI